MGVGTTFDAVSRLVDRFEAEGVEVLNVEVTADRGEAPLDVTLEFPLAAAGTATPAAATVTDDGDVRVTYDGQSLPRPPADVDATRTDVAARVADGRVLVAVSFVVAGGSRSRTGADRADDAAGSTALAGSAGGVDVAVGAGDDDGEGEASAGDAGVVGPRDPSVPPYDDEPYLRALYDACETFVEMSDRIPMDVSAETVRRYMIEAGVHEPDSYDTRAGDDEASEGDGDGTDAADPDPGASADPDPEATAADDPAGDGGDDGPGAAGPTADGEAGAGAGARDGDDPAREDASDGDGESSREPAVIPDERVVADGVGLPEGVALADVADAVVESTAEYQVSRRLGLDHAETRRLLEDLDLLDLLHHRLADHERVATSYEQVAARIRRCAPGA